MDMEEMRAAYMRAIATEVMSHTHPHRAFTNNDDPGVLGLRKAQDRFSELLTAGNELIELLGKDHEMQDPETQRALARWNALQ
jgi:hypothetical protein